MFSISPANKHLSSFLDNKRKWNVNTDLIFSSVSNTSASYTKLGLSMSVMTFSLSWKSHHFFFSPSCSTASYERKATVLSLLFISEMIGTEQMNLILSIFYYVLRFEFLLWWLGSKYATVICSWSVWLIVMFPYEVYIYSFAVPDIYTHSTIYC